MLETSRQACVSAIGIVLFRNMSFPLLPSVNAGDSVVMVAPARWVDEPLVQYTEQWLHEAGLQAIRAPNLLSRRGQLAGTDAQRTADLQWAFDHAEAKAILAMRGGYGSHRCVDMLDLEGIRARPKVFCGFSDMSAVHLHLQRHGLRSVHCAMPSTFAGNSPSSLDSILHILSLGASTLEWDCDLADMNAVGRLYGGNLSVLHSLLCTPSWPQMEDALLFIEDLDEMIYHVDRMLYHMHRAGVFKGVQALLVGGMSDMRDNTTAHGFSTDNPFGRDAHSILKEICKLNGIPLITGVPAGHLQDNRALVLGSLARFELSGGHATLHT
jgi:muramoyltetrapeptide carboxypeptidase